MTEKNKGGRPTKYKERYCQDIIDFFTGHELTRERVKATGKDDYTATEEIANIYPTFHDFAKTIGVNYSTARDWVDRYPKFHESYNRCKKIQHEIIVKCALSGLYNASFSIFAMKNIAGWRDKRELEHTGKDGGAIKTQDVSKLDIKALATLIQEKLN